MNKLKLTTFIMIVALFVLSIFFFTDNKKISRQSAEISGLEAKVQELENKVSQLESEKKSLEGKISQLTENDDNYNYNESMGSLNYQNILPQTFSESSTSGRGFATVVYKPSSCDYFILENSSGYIIAEWIGGHDPDLGDRITGNFNSFGTKDFYNESHNSDCRLWVDDYMLSKDSALEKIKDKCN